MLPDGHQRKIPFFVGKNFKPDYSKWTAESKKAEASKNRCDTMIDSCSEKTNKEHIKRMCTNNDYVIMYVRTFERDIYQNKNQPDNHNNMD